MEYSYWKPGSEFSCVYSSVYSYGAHLTTLLLEARPGQTSNCG